MSSGIPVTRFSYVPEECFETIDAALGAKPMAEWKIVQPWNAFALVTEVTPERVMLKCVDGANSRVSTPSVPS